MQRLSNLVGQIRPSPTAGTTSDDGSSANKPMEQGLDMTPELMTTIMQYRQSIDELKNEGVFPSMTIFDLQLATKFELGVASEGDANTMLDAAEKSGALEILKKLPGPWEGAKTRAAQVELLQHMGFGQATGSDVFQFAKWQQEFGKRGLNSNIIVPIILGTGTGSDRGFGVNTRVILSDAADSERISRTHVRKEGNFEVALYDGIIATTDNDHWQAQRHHLAEAFMPLSSLAKIMPVSLARAKQCTERLVGLAAGGAAVDMSDFLLHEAQAQLQLALLGAPEKLMNETNEDIRAAFIGDLEHGKVGALGDAMKSLMELAATDQSLALPTDENAVKGPLSRAVQTSNMSAQTNYGNMLLILFAGHDTTGHTMTWLMFEVARHPEIQIALRKEADAFFKKLGGRDPEYRDLAETDLLDRCVTETLRMWPAVANGTFRQLQYEDTVTGSDGKPVSLPKGTFVNIMNWSRHRNPDLWGADVNEFNPYRDFTKEELAKVGCSMAGANIQSERFSPFAHAPRGCLGRNFAQMEMRLILLYLFHRFEFKLAPPYDSLATAKLGATPDVNEFRGINRATMGPMDLEQSSQKRWGTRHVYAMKMFAREDVAA